MNLLLLLSALLSALSGAYGVRGAETPVTVARAVEQVAPARVMQVAESSRPSGAVPARDRQRRPHLAAWRLAPIEPIYLSRRRE